MWQVLADTNFELVCNYLATFVGEFEPLPKKIEVEVALCALAVQYT